jgi:hypothetical protein
MAAAESGEPTPGAGDLVVGGMAEFAGRLRTGSVRDGI